MIAQDQRITKAIIKPYSQRWELQLLVCRLVRLKSKSLTRVSRSPPVLEVRGVLPRVTKGPVYLSEMSSESREMLIEHGLRWCR